MSDSPPDLDLLSRVPDPFSSQEGGQDGTGPLPAPPALPTAASPARADHARRLGVVVALALVFQAAWVALASHKLPLDEYSLHHLVFGLGLPLVAAGLTGVIATSRGRRGLGVSASWLGAGMAAATLLFVGLTLATAPADHDASAMAFLDRAMRCVVQAVVLGAVALGLVSYAFRRAFVTASTWRTAALGVACGGLAAATMSLACFHREAMHVVVGHGAMIVVGGIVGAIVGRRFTRV
jgi:hypothetical protein